MQVIIAGYNGVRLIAKLNADRLLTATVLTGALALGAMAASFF